MSDFHVETALGCIAMDIQSETSLISRFYYNGQRYRMYADEAGLFPLVHEPKVDCKLAEHDSVDVVMPVFEIDEEVHVRRSPRHPCVSMYIKSLEPLRAVGERVFIDIDERNIMQVHRPGECLYAKNNQERV